MPSSRRSSARSLCAKARLQAVAAVRIACSFYEFSGTVQELSSVLFGEQAEVILGGEPLACACPAAGCIADISLPTLAGINPQRIKARALIQHMGRMLGDEGSSLFAVYGNPDGAALEPLPLERSVELEALQDAFLPRMRAQNDNAATIACYLVCHPAISQVFYPGLKDDASFVTAAQVLAHGFGNAIDCRMEGAASLTRLFASEGDPFEQIAALERRLAR